MNCDLNVQGKKVKCIYGYKATMNDELNIKIDDIIVLTQCSEDETWLEGTLNGITGWFPSNHVQLIDDGNGLERSETAYQLNDYIDEALSFSESNYNKINETLRIKYINEFKKAEESFLDEMCKFFKVVLIPLQSSNDTHSLNFVQPLSASIDEVVRCHQMFYQQLKEIPDNSDAKIGNLLMNLAGHFKSVYEGYARNNPKFTNIITSKSEQLNRFFESSLSKIISALMPVSSNTAVSIYITKFLAFPFKQLEIYVKILKEIYRFTEDYHVDRGDLQRCIEFYSNLLVSVQETRKKKEYELDILSSKINHLDTTLSEVLFKNGEVQFISTVLVVNENGEIRDRIMLILPNTIIFLKQGSVNQINEFDFDFKITISPTVQLKKITDLNSVNSLYGDNLMSSSLTSSYLFEISGLQPGMTSGSRILVACPTQYDLKQSYDLITGISAKNRVQPANKNIVKRQDSTGASPKQAISQQDSAFTLHQSRDCTSPTNLTSSNYQNTNVNSLNTISASTSTNNTNSFTQAAPTKKMFSLRPHPPLIPQFQLPNDPQHINSPDGSLTLKRFMYKKIKLSEPFGKYHGADDDLKMLSVVESFFKSRARQSVAINKQPPETKKVTKPIESSKLNEAEKTLVKSGEKKAEKERYKEIEKELEKCKRSNREMEKIINNLQCQLENERIVRKKLEIFIRKQIKNKEEHDTTIKKEENGKFKRVEHESSI